MGCVGVCYRNNDAHGSNSIKHKINKINPIYQTLQRVVSDFQYRLISRKVVQFKGNDCSQYL